MRLYRSFVLVLLCLLTHPVWAHPGHDVGEAGAAHELASPDHLGGVLIAAFTLMLVAVIVAAVKTLVVRFRDDDHIPSSPA